MADQGKAIEKEVLDWKSVHCHKSPIATPDSLHVLRS